MFYLHNTKGQIGRNETRADAVQATCINSPAGKPATEPYRSVTQRQALRISSLPMLTYPDDQGTLHHTFSQR